jgi:hypothetical protein
LSDLIQKKGKDRMFVIQFLARSRIAKVALIGVVGGVGLFTVAANVYIRFHYAAVMPRSPQRESGKIYALPAQYGGVVYVNQQELDRRDFVRNDLGSASAVGGILLFLLGTRAGWFERSKRHSG